MSNNENTDHVDDSAIEPDVVRSAEEAADQDNSDGKFDGFLQVSWLPRLGFNTEGFSRKEKFRFYALISLVAVLSYLFVEPLIQPVLAEAWKYSPALFLGAIGVALLLYTINQISLSRGDRTRLQAVGSTIAFALAGLLIYLNSAAWSVESNMARVLRPTTLDQLPVTVQDRMLPKVLADEYAKQGNRNNEMVAETSSHLLVTAEGKGHLSWQTAYRYDKGLSHLPRILLGSIEKIVGLNAGVVDMDADLVSGGKARFLYGADSWVTRLVFRWLHPLSHEGQVSYYRNPDGKWVILLSYWTHTPTITGVSIPKMTGVMEISGNGLVRNYSPAVAAEKFEGAILYPTSLVRAYADAYARWHSGLYNVVISRSGIEEVSEDPVFSIAHNPMPYVQRFEDIGLQEYIALEPQGNQSYALSRLMFFDTETGRASEYVPSEKVSYNGPRKAMINVVNSDPEVNWAHFDKVEPLLFTTRQGDIYFLVNAIREDENSGVHTKGFLVLVESVHLKPQKFKNAEEVRAFVPDSLGSAASSNNL